MDPSADPLAMAKRPATTAEARALAHPLRLRILRLCLDGALTNRELADRLGSDPATVLHHVRTLVRTGFLAADPERTGRRGARERPYRATGKSWTLDVHDGATGLLAQVDALRDELLEAGPEALLSSARLGVRLTPEVLVAFQARFMTLVEELKDADDPDGEAVSLFLALHRQDR